MSRAEFTNAVLTDICQQLLDEGLTREEVKNLAADIPGEFRAMADNRAEAAWMEHQQSLMETGGTDNSAYRRDMIAAGRGHLLGGAA